MQLLCLYCGNYTYFECTVQTVKAVTPDGEGVLIENAKYADMDYSEESLRDNLRSLVELMLSEPDSEWEYDPETETYYSPHMQCARCGRCKVTVPGKVKSSPMSLDDEIKAHRDELNWLKKERSNYANDLPRLRE